MISDFLLIRRMKQGDEVSFDTFVRKYYKDILVYCSYHCSDREYAEDITQETFVRFFAKLSEYHHTGQAKNYLYTIAGNLCKDYFRKVRELPVDDLDFDAKVEHAESPMDDVLNRVTVEWALEQLPEEFRQVVVLYYFQELKLWEIADVLQIGVPLVKYRLRRARMQLGELLNGDRIF